VGLFETDRCHEVYKKINGVVKDETILTIRLMSLGGNCITHLDETVKEGESMLQGVCIDTGSATILEKGKKYFFDFLENEELNS
jgi:hypothetical protein